MIHPAKPFLTPRGKTLTLFCPWGGKNVLKCCSHDNIALSNYIIFQHFTKMHCNVLNRPLRCAALVCTVLLATQFHGHMKCHLQCGTKCAIREDGYLLMAHECCHDEYFEIRKFCMCCIYQYLDIKIFHNHTKTS